MKASIGQEDYQKLVIEDAVQIKWMSHRVNLEVWKNKYSIGIEKNWKMMKSERSSCGIDLPAEMDGGLKVQNIQKKYVWYLRILKQIFLAGEYVELPEDDEGNNKTFDRLSMKEKQTFWD